MDYKRKLLKMLLLIILLALALYYIPQNSARIRQYDLRIFYPFQSFRGWLFGIVPFSVGDIIYILGGIWIVSTIIKWIRYIAGFGSHKTHLGLSLLTVINNILFVYLFFFIGWGANYYKPSLREYWGLTNPAEADTTWRHDEVLRREYRVKDSLALVSFDSFLVHQLNTYAPHCYSLPFKEVNDRTVSYYKTYTDCMMQKGGLGVKPSFFGYFMERIGVEGYYNPFTGEGQVNTRLPGFIMPFLVCHEIAHQAGIAAEDDANLVAYALCTATNDSTFHYSSYLDIWLYTNYRLARRNKAAAKQLAAQLNKLTLSHIDTLEQISMKYQNKIARYSSDLYDNYLKMHDQKEGIRSYGNASASAWQLEQKRMAGGITIITIP